MSFIKNFTEKLMEAEYRPIANFYDNSNIGENTEHLGLIKQVGSIAYGVVIINADKKYDYQGFYKDVLSFFTQLKKVIVIGVFVSREPDSKLLDFTKHSVEDYSESLIDVRWTVDITKNELIVRGNQPDKVNEIDRLIRESFHKGGYTVPQNISVLQQKSYEKRKSEIKSTNIYMTLGLIAVNGVIELFLLFSGLRNDVITEGGIYRGGIISGQWYRLVTYMFIHGGITHYLGNALSLYILGSRIEKYYGKLKMLIMYFISGIGAGIFSMFLSGNLAVGASGAIFGLMAGILVYTKIKNRSVEGFDTYFVIIFAIMGIFSGFLFTDVDNWGHIGGFVTGLAASIAMMKGEANEKV